jgi:hypothetical protein
MRVQVLTYLLILVIISSSVQAFGISFPYMDNDTIKLYPGQGYLFKLTIQNKDNESITVDVTVDSPIANLVGESQLEVPGVTYDTSVFINITLPKDAKPGEIYDVSYAVSPVGKGEGQIPIAVAYSRSFKVLVAEIPKESTGPTSNAIIPPESGFSLPAWLVIPLIVIIILVVGILLWNKSHQMSERISKPSTGAKPLSQISLPSTPSFTPPMYEQEEQKHITTSLLLGKADDDKEIKEIFPRTSQSTPCSAQEKIIAPHHYFHLRNGQSLKNLGELYPAISNMNDDEFRHHVNAAKNDFANWIYHILEKKELANKLFRTTNKEEILGLIKDELDKE